MEQVTIPYSGTLLVAHLAAYGLAFVLDDAGIDAFVGHDGVSQSFEPFVAFDADRDAARDAIRASAAQAEPWVEHDLEPGRSGNDRRATIWARASLEPGGERLAQAVALRAGLVERAHGDGAVPSGLLAGLGAPASWGPERMKSPAGATALDGVLGNNTSDFVRGVLRPTRRAAELLESDPFAPGALDGLPFDKSGWAPPGTRVDYVHQWLAALGLALLPVAHRPLRRSATPAFWRRGRAEGWRSGVTLPLLDAPASVPRLRALLALQALPAITSDAVDEGDAAVAAGELRSLGVEEVVVFERRDRSGAGSSVAFDFQRGRLVALR
jgi:hypothetical protein